MVNLSVEDNLVDKKSLVSLWNLERLDQRTVVSSLTVEDCLVTPAWSVSADGIVCVLHLAVKAR